MREARLILPVENGALAAAQAVAARLADRFGGITRSPGQGSWFDGDKLITENVLILDVAYEISQENDEKLFEEANAFRVAAQQKEVYLRYGSGMVQMVSETSKFMDDGLWQGYVDAAE